MGGYACACWRWRGPLCGSSGGRFGGYYLPEIATQFVMLGIGAGVIGCLFRLDGMHANKAMQAFRQGAMDLLLAALVVGFARGIVFLLGGDDLTQPSLLNTLLYYGGESLNGLPVRPRRLGHAVLPVGIQFCPPAPARPR